VDGGRTVEGLEGLRIITNGVTGLEFEDLQSYMMLQEHRDDVIESAMELRAEWAIDSGSPLSLAMDKQVAEVLNLPQRGYGDLLLVDLSEVQKESVAAIYDVTQRIFLRREITDVVVYRGLCWQEHPDWMGKQLKVGQRVQFECTRTLSSWSLEREVAEKFAAEKNYGVVLKAAVPTKRIFAILSIMDEAEAVCLNHNGDEEFEIVSITGGESA